MKISLFRIFLFTVCTTVAVGCTLYNDSDGLDNESYTEVESTYESITAQEKAEKGIEEYVRKTDPNGSNYKSYNFGQLYRLPAPEIKELEELQKLRDSLPSLKQQYGSKYDSMQTAYDTLIAVKQREIKTRNIRSQLIISHLYTVKFANDPGGNVYEADFILDADFHVVDYRAKLAAKLNDDDFEWFFYFFRQTNLLGSGDIEADNADSDRLYDFYNTRLASLTDGKEEFLKTALRTTRCIYRYKAVDKSRISAYILMKYLQEYEMYPNYHPVKFSPVEDIYTKTPAGDSLIGYKNFHLFEHTDSLGKKTQSGVYAEFDVYFVPAGLLKLEPPFDKYFGE
ncbi:MAG: hypothetical protein ACHQF2_04090 [Flavobacteriales bacterium]